MSNKSKATHIALAVFIALLFTQPAFAAKIKTVKGKKVIVDLENDTFKSGDILKIENAAGKTVGLTKLVKIKGQMAEGLLKGKAQAGYTAKLRPPKAAKPKTVAANAYAANFTGNKRPMHLGIIAGASSTNADVQLPNGNPEVALSGTGFSLKGLMDYSLFPWLGFRGLAGLEQFAIGGANNTGTGGCGGECTAEINYLTFDFWARYLVAEQAPRLWFGAGFSLMFPISKDSTALDEESITNTSLISVGAGYDFKMSETTHMPIQLEYNMYPSSEDVTASSIAARIGYSFSF